MALKGNAAFLVDGPSGEQVYLCSVPPRIVSTRQIRRRYTEDSLDLRTRNIVTIGAPVYEVTMRARFADRPADLLALLDAAAHGYPITYIHDLSQPDGYAFALIHGDDAIQATPDPDRYAYGEYDTTLVLRSSTPFPALLGSSDVLFRYHAGGAADSLTFSRASTAYRITRGGVLESVAANVLRTEWLDLDGDGVRETPATLVEGAGENVWTYSEDLTNAVWTKAGCDIVADGRTAPDGTTSMDFIREDGSTGLHYVSRSIPDTTDGSVAVVSVYLVGSGRQWVNVRTFDRAGVGRSAFLRLSDGTLGTVSSGATARVHPLGGGVYRVDVSWDVGTGGNTPVAQLRLATGDGGDTYQGDGASGLYVWGLQAEVGRATASSYMPTSDAPFVRALDHLSATVQAIPQEMVIYVRFVERGTVLGTDFARVLQLSGAHPRIEIRTDNAGHYRATVTDSTGATLSGSTVSTAAPDVDDPVELLLAVRTDGLRLYQSIVGGDAVDGGVGAAFSLPAAFGDDTLYINSASASNYGAIALRDILILRGSGWTMDAARRLLP